MLHYINYQQFNVATQTRNDILQFRFIQEDYNNITIQLVKAQWATAENETIEQELEAEKHNIKVNKSKFRGLYGTGEIEGEKVILSSCLISTRYSLSYSRLSMT